MKRGERWIFVLALLVGLFAVNLFSAHHFIRWDLTEQKEYTLSPATKKLLQGLDDVVTIRLYFSGNLPPALLSLRRDVGDLLGEFRTYAGAKLHIENFNPDEDQVTEQKVQMMGIPPLTVNVIQKDKQELAKVYLGMAVQFGDKQAVLPVVQSISNLEYQLTATIIKVSQKEKPKLGWYASTSAQESTDKPGLKLLREQLEDRYTIQEVDPKKIAEWSAKETPATILFVADPLDAKLWDKLEGYLKDGGKLLVFAETVAVEAGLQAKPQTLNINDFLKNHHIEVETDLALDQSNAMATFSGGMISYHIPYAYWPRVIRDTFDKKNPVTAELESLVFPWVSSLKIMDDPDKKTTILATTTSYGVTQAITEPTSLDPTGSEQAYGNGVRKETPLVAMENSNLLVVGNLRFVRDDFLKQFPENLTFFENAVDYFSLGESLIGIRSKSGAERPLVVISDQRKVLVKTLNMALTLVILMGTGVSVYWMRRSRHKALRIAYQ